MGAAARSARSCSRPVSAPGLEPLTYIRAKAAVPVNGETLARRVIRWLVGQGIHDVVLNLHHLPATISGTVGDGSDSARARSILMGEPGAGIRRRPKRALPLLVDSIATAARIPQRGFQPILHREWGYADRRGPAGMLSPHVASGAVVTMALIPNPRPEKYGGVAVSEGRVTGFTRAGGRARPTTSSVCRSPKLEHSSPSRMAFRRETVNELIHE